MALVNLIIRFRDQATSGVKGVGSALGGLAGQARSAAGETQGLVGAITQGVLQANAIQFAIGKATEAIGFMNSKFEEAKNLQLEQINAATTFSSLTGQSFEEASRFIEGLNDRLAKSAATLPGATQDYKQLAIAVQDNVLEAFKDPSGTLNQEGFENTLASMAESFGALTAASTRDIGNTTLGLSQALSGQSIASLREIAFFQQNPVILNEIEKRLKEQNKQMKDLSIRERVDLLREVGEKFITEDFKKRASESVDGLLQSFQSTLFDPGAGIFGIMRDLDPATDGVQSAFKSMNEALIEVIGPSGIVFQFADLLKEAGIELVDPMAALKGSVDFVTRGLRRVNEAITFMRDLVMAGDGLGDAVLTAIGILGGGMQLDPGAIANTVTTFLTRTGEQLGSLYEGIYGVIAPLFNQGVRAVSEFFANTGQMYEIGVAFGGVLGRMAGAAIAFLGQIDYPQLLIGIGRVAIGIFAALVGSVGGMALGILPGIGSLIVNLGRAVFEAFQVGILAIGQTIREAFLGLVTSQLVQFQTLINSGIGGLFAFIINTGKAILTGIQQTFSGIIEQARTIPLLGSLIPQAPPPGQAIAVGARYAGQVGWAAGGFVGDLLGAAQQEMRRMPPGANLMVANSSETILPQGALGPFLRSLPLGNGGGGNVFNISVTAPGGDPEAIAEAVMQAIERRFEGEMQAQFG